MMKTMLMIGAAAISFPALAQSVDPMADDSMAPPTQTEPLPDPAPVPDDSTYPPAEPAPAPEPVPDTDTPPVDGAPPADPISEPAPSGAAATPTQIAQIVDQEFPTYDGDASGELNEAEFSAWMKKLRAATDPTVDVESEEVKSWIGQAWTVADADASGGVNKDELTAFLSRGA